MTPLASSHSFTVRPLNFIIPLKILRPPLPPPPWAKYDKSVPYIKIDKDYDDINNNNNNNNIISNDGNNNNDNDNNDNDNSNETFSQIFSCFPSLL